jgi:protein TonB
VYSPDVWSIYVKENLRYPPQALRERKECNVFVAVIIREDGSLELDKERALYGCEEYFNEEVRRLIANAPRFIPATDANGKPKNRINLKISFKLP